MPTLKTNPARLIARLCRGAVGLIVAVGLLAAPFARAQPAGCVIHISVDGLRPDAITALGPAALPNFYRLRVEGAWTDNARSDYDYTITLPNHATELTGRGVAGAAGHNWTSNSDPAPGDTLASHKGSYVAGVFDVAHDHGLRTGAYVSKTKFSLFATSWNAANGAADLTGSDNGKNKIDVYFYASDTEALVSRFVADMVTQPFQYAFIHLTDLDTVGHSAGWNPAPGSAYSNAVLAIDARLGAIFDLLDSDPRLAGCTAMILTADHGGTGTDHSTATLAPNYTVPFYVWGPDVTAGADLYALNPGRRLNPGGGRPAYSAALQPVRNGEAANAALQLLGLAPVPGATLNAGQNLALALPLPDDFGVALIAGDAVLHFTTEAGLLYDVQFSDDLTPGSWHDLALNLPGSGGVQTVNDAGAATRFRRFYRVIVHY